MSGTLLGSPTPTSWGQMMSDLGNYSGSNGIASTAPSAIYPTGLGNYAGSSNQSIADALNKIGDNSSFGPNLATAQFGLQGLASIGQLYSAFSAASLAKKSFNFQRDLANINLNNQIKSYNTSLADRITSRGVQEGLSNDQVNDYINKNSVSR